MPEYKECFSWVAKAIRSAIKIILPPNGEIYRDNTIDGFDGGSMPTAEESESFIMPCVLTCFEYEWTHLGPDGKCDAPRRITLVLDQTNGEAVPAGMVGVVQFWSIFWVPEVKRWTIWPATISICKPPKFMMQASAKSRIEWGWQTAGGFDFAKRTNDLGPEITGEIRGDITAVIQFCHAVRAGAKISEIVDGSFSSRRHFEKRGAGGFLYHELALPNNQKPKADSRGGSHSAPRLHIRRAHIRKLPSGSLTFVRQCLVGDVQRGIVDKHYRALPNSHRP